jgi:hypothetical protein
MMNDESKTTLAFYPRAGRSTASRAVTDTSARQRRFVVGIHHSAFIIGREIANL